MTNVIEYFNKLSNARLALLKTMLKRIQDLLNVRDKARGHTLLLNFRDHWK